MAEGIPNKNRKDKSCVEKVSGMCGHYLDKITFHHKDGDTIMCGGNGGSKKPDFILKQGEYITLIKGRDGPYLGGGITIITNKKRKHKFFGSKYSSSGPEYSFQAKSGHEIIGLKARNNNIVDCIQRPFNETNTQKEARKQKLGAEREAERKRREKKEAENNKKRRELEECERRKALVFCFIVLVGFFAMIIGGSHMVTQAGKSREKKIASFRSGLELWETELPDLIQLRFSTDLTAHTTLVTKISTDLTGTITKTVENRNYSKRIFTHNLSLARGLRFSKDEKSIKWNRCDWNTTMLYPYQKGDNKKITLSIFHVDEINPNSPKRNLLLTKSYPLLSQIIIWKKIWDGLKSSAGKNYAKNLAKCKKLYDHSWTKLHYVKYKKNNKKQKAYLRVYCSTAGIARNACFYFNTDRFGDVVPSPKWGCNYPYNNNTLGYVWPRTGEKQPLTIYLRHHRDPLQLQSILTKGKGKWGGRRKDEIVGPIIMIVFGSIFVLCWYNTLCRNPPEKEAPKKEAPKKEAPKKEAPKKEAPKKKAPKKKAPKKAKTSEHGEKKSRINNNNEQHDEIKLKGDYPVDLPPVLPPAETYPPAEMYSPPAAETYSPPAAETYLPPAPEKYSPPPVETYSQEGVVEPPSYLPPPDTDLPPAYDAVQLDEI